MGLPLDDRELGAVLAGLRLLQETLWQRTGLPRGIHEIYADAGLYLDPPHTEIVKAGTRAEALRAVQDFGYGDQAELVYLEPREAD